MSGQLHNTFEDPTGPGDSPPPSVSRPVGPAPRKEAPASDPKLRAQEAFDVGVWAALDLCRLHQIEGAKYNPFSAFEERILLLALRSTRGNQYRAAKLLGISRSTLRKRMKKHGILIGVRVVENRPPSGRESD